MIITNHGAPTVNTCGNIGDLYIDVDTNTMYKCIDTATPDISHQFMTIQVARPEATEYIWESCVYTIKDFSYFCNQNNNSRVSELKNINTSKGTDFSHMFENCQNLSSIPVKKMDTTNGTNFSHMFYKCSKLSSIPELDTSNGTNFTYMFNNCSNLRSIPEIDTSNGTDLSYMFYCCSKLASIPELDTSNGTNFAYMFYSCGELTSVPELDTSNGTNFSSMFNGECPKLISIPKLDVRNGTNLNNITKGCTALSHLRLYNIRSPLTIGTTTYGQLLDVDSLVHTIKELCKVSTSTKLAIGTTNTDKIAGLYCRVLDDTTEKIEMELCESTDEGAMTLVEYAALKNWTIA